MALMALSIDMMLPAFDLMRRTYGLAADSTTIGQTITTFFAGMAIAQLMWGPLSDRFGRRPVFYAGLVVYIVGAIASALAPTIATLLIARTVWGVGAAGPRVIVTALIRDTSVGDAMAEAMSQVMAVFILVPIFAPSLGALVISFAPWQTVFWLCGGAAMVMGIWGSRLPETLDPAHQRPIRPRELSDATKRIIATPLTFRTTVAQVAIQAALTLYLTSSERIVSQVFDRGSLFPYVFGSIATVLALGAIANGRIVKVLGLARTIRLQATAMVVTGTLLLTLILLDPTPGFYAFHIVFAAATLALVIAFPNLGAAGMIPVGDMAGTASSVIGAARLGGGAALAAVASLVMGPDLNNFVFFAIGFGAVAAATSLLTPLDRRTD